MNLQATVEGERGGEDIKQGLEGGKEEDKFLSTFTLEGRREGGTLKGEGDQVAPSTPFKVRPG